MDNHAYRQLKFEESSATLQEKNGLDGSSLTVSGRQGMALKTTAAQTAAQTATADLLVLFQLPPKPFGLFLVFLLSLPYFSVGSSAIGDMLMHIPIQVYWTFCLYRLIDAIESLSGKQLSRRTITVLSFLAFAFMPVLSSHSYAQWADPFFIVWVILQLGCTYVIGKYFDEMQEESAAKQSFHYRVIFTLLGNAYLLLGLLNGNLLNTPFVFNLLWFSSQFSWIVVAARLIRTKLVTFKQPESSMSRELAFVADSDIEIRYRALPGVERWLEQRFSGEVVKRGAKLMFMTVLAPVLVIGGVSLAACLFSSLLIATKPVAGAASPVVSSASVAGLPFIPFMFFGIMAIAVGGFLLHRKQPTHLYLNSHGIGFLRSRGSGKKHVKSVSWSNLSQIFIHKPSGQTSNLRDQLCFRQTDGKVFRIKLDSIDSYEDKECILKAIKIWAPAVIRDAKVLECLQAPADYSYTELWLQALSAPPQRERLKPLVSGVKLKQGKYLVDRPLGVGGQGTAYLAADVLSAEQVVLKEFILPVFVDMSVRKSALEQFENEARILRQLNHPQVVKLLDYFVEDHRAYLVLEHIDGEPLEKIVKDRGALKEPEVVALALQMCDILRYLHGLAPPVVHRDFTPDNLILASSGRLKLIDFNVAQQQESTASGTVVGKQAYLPPEQFRGMPSSQSDIYSMGASLQFLLTGQEPEPISVSYPRQINPSVSEDINALVARATAIDLAKRYKRIQDLESDLLNAANRDKQQSAIVEAV